MDDLGHMQAALGLARRGLGTTWPNPAVGCVVVAADGRVAGRAVTAPGGRPHAETQALAMAGPAARDGCAYVTLEPCSHVGHTPPCAEALIAAGVARVVVGCGDPDPRVSGAGLALLRAAGVEVVEGVLGAEARAVAEGFLRRVGLGRPMVTLKLASSLDGRIAARGGDSRWITGTASRRVAHGMRASHDAVMCGVGTVLADDPELTCRIEGARAWPLVRVVADGSLRTPVSSRMVAGARRDPVWLLHRPGAAPGRVAAVEATGALPIEVPGEAADGDVRPGDDVSPQTGIDLAAGLRALAARGLTRVLVEGGGRLAAGLLRAGLVDGVAWFHAPGVIGGDGIAAVHDLGLDAVAAMPRFETVASRRVGCDVLTEMRRRD